LLNYIRYQLDQLPKPAPSTVNHRLAVLGCLYRFHYGCEIPAGKAHFHRRYTRGDDGETVSATQQRSWEGHADGPSRKQTGEGSW
jgi:hypothetical protein